MKNKKKKSLSASWRNSLIEMGLGNRQEAAVSVGLDGENQRFPSQDGELAHELSGMGNEETGVLLRVYLPLVHVKHARDHKANINILQKMERELNKIPKGFKGNYRSDSTTMTDLFSRKLPIVFEQLGDKMRHNGELLKAGYEYLKLSSHNIEKRVSLCMVMKNEGCICTISRNNSRIANGDNGVIAAAGRGTSQVSSFTSAP